MKTVIVKTQSEWDILPKSYTDHTIIEIRCKSEIIVRITPDSSTVRACDSSTVTAYDSSTVTAYGSSTVTAYGSSTVTAYDSSTVRACDSSTVTACGSSTVTAYDSSTVTACGSSTVTAYDSSTVRAYGSSTVRAYGSSTVRAESAISIITLFAFSVAFVKLNMKVLIKSKNATVITVRPPKTATEWLDFHGVEHSKEAVLFKRVSHDFKTQEKTSNETTWSIGSVLEHPNWGPSLEECGAGKFHACHHPSACDMYRVSTGDKYVAIKIDVNAMFVWKDDPQHPNKIAFRKGTVLYECDVNGNKK